MWIRCSFGSQGVHPGQGGHPGQGDQDKALVDKAVVWGKCNQGEAVVWEEDNQEEANVRDEDDQDNLSVVLAMEVEDNTMEVDVVLFVVGRVAVVLAIKKEDNAIEAA